MSLQFFWSFGAVFLSFAAWAIMPTLGWRYLVGFSTIPLALFVCMSPFVLPESPFYLASVGDKQRLELELEKVIRLRENQTFYSAKSLDSYSRLSNKRGVTLIYFWK